MGKRQHQRSMRRGPRSSRSSTTPEASNLHTAPSCYTLLRTMSSVSLRSFLSRGSSSPRKEEAYSEDGVALLHCHGCEDMDVRKRGREVEGTAYSTHAHSMHAFSQDLRDLTPLGPPGLTNCLDPRTPSAMSSPPSDPHHMTCCLASQRTWDGTGTAHLNSFNQRGSLAPSTTCARHQREQHMEKPS